MACELQALDEDRFATIAARLQPLCDTLRGTLGSEFDQAAANLGTDPLLSVDQKFGVADALLATTASEASAVRDAAMAYGDARPRLGPDVSADTGPILGHVMTRAKLAALFGSAGDPTTPLTLLPGASSLAVDELLAEARAAVRERLHGLDAGGPPRYPRGDIRPHAWSSRHAPGTR